MGIIEMISKYFDPSKVEVNANIQNLGMSYPGGFIRLRKDHHSNDEKVKTLIHELLHQEKKYGGPLCQRSKEELLKLMNKRIGAEFPKKDPDKLKHEIEEQNKLENAIEKETEAIFASQPRLVVYLKHRLGLTFSPWAQFMIDRNKGQQYLFYSYEFNPHYESLRRIL